jgi:ubiquinone/menaquinone biosynthesis C-methylase UbiE
MYHFFFTNRENRAKNRLIEHYEVEKALANKLKNSTQQERTYLYSEVYDELFRKIPDHPQLTIETNKARSNAISWLRILRPFINKNVTFLEVGPGDCVLSFEVANHVRSVIAIDVSEEVIKSNWRFKPPNFELVISNGSSINVQQNSINVAFSNQLMEHLHPDDSFRQLKNIYEALAPGGVYICITPHRFSGPHDISKLFDEVATGFHLKEYTYTELISMLKKVGFSKLFVIVGTKGIYVKIPPIFLILFENFIEILPKKIRKAICHNLMFQVILGIKIIAIK